MQATNRFEQDEAKAEDAIGTFSPIPSNCRESIEILTETYQLPSVNILINFSRWPLSKQLPLNANYSFGRKTE